MPKALRLQERRIDAQSHRRKSPQEDVQAKTLRNKTALLALAVAAAACAQKPEEVSISTHPLISAAPWWNEMNADGIFAEQLMKHVRDDRFTHVWKDSQSRNHRVEGRVYSQNGTIMVERLGPERILTNASGQPITADAYLPIWRSDGRTLSEIVVLAGTIKVNGQERWERGLSACPWGTAKVQPSNDRDRIKIITEQHGVARVHIDDPDYCAAAQRDVDTSEASPSSQLEHESAAETPDILLRAFTRRSNGEYMAFLKAAALNGNLVDYQRRTNGTWGPEGTPPGTFPQNDASDLGFVGGTVKLRVPTTQGGSDGPEMSFVSGGEAVATVFALEKLPNGDLLEHTNTATTVNLNPGMALNDSDGDGIPDAVELAAGGGQCVGRPNPGAPIDLNNDGIADECDDIQWTGNMDSNGMEIGMPLPGFPVVRRIDGTIFRSNMDVQLSGRQVVAQPGQTIRMIHTAEVGQSVQPAFSMRFPDGNSVRIQARNTLQLNGAPGMAVFHFRPFVPGQPAGPRQDLQLPGPMNAMRDMGVVVEGSLTIEGCYVDVTVGTENLTVVPDPLDAGVVLADATSPDAVVTQFDASEPDAVVVVYPDATSSDVVTTQFDAGFQTLPDANEQAETGSTTIDGGTMGPLDTGNIRVDSGAQTGDVAPRDGGRTDGSADTSSPRDANTPSRDATMPPNPDATAPKPDAALPTTPDATTQPMHADAATSMGDPDGGVTPQPADAGHEEPEPPGGCSSVSVPEEGPSTEDILAATALAALAVSQRPRRRKEEAEKEAA